MAALSMQHSKRLEEMIEQHKEELRKLEGIKDEELKVLLRGLGSTLYNGLQGSLCLKGVPFTGFRE